MLKYRKIYYIFSGFLVAVSWVLLILFGLNAGIDFTGGTLWEISLSDQNKNSVSSVSPYEIQKILLQNQDVQLTDVRVQSAENHYIIRLRNLNEEEHQKLLVVLKSGFASEKEGEPSQINVLENRYESVGPTIGTDIAQKAWWQILLVSVAIVLYIAYAFRKVGKVRKESATSWKLGVVALIALVHDVSMTAGVFALLGRLLHVEIDSSFVAAILLVLGYSVNDTIVVFDRLRENMIRNKFSHDFASIVNMSVRDTMVRSLNTSSTTLIVLFSLLFFGGASTFYFILALTIGIGVGTYSSIFLATPLFYEWEKKSYRAY